MDPRSFACSLSQATPSRNPGLALFAIFAERAAAAAGYDVAAAAHAADAA